MKSLLVWIQGVAAALGAPGLFLVAALDSSFLSLPQVNDLLLILSVTRHPELMPLYAAMSTLGSLAGGSYTVVALIGGIVAVAALRARRLADGLNALALGEAAAGHVGIDVQRLRGRVIALVALLCALAVAWCGVIGFIGLIAPHWVRMIAGPDHRVVLPASGLLGAVLVLAADTVARTVMAPTELPLGVLTAFIGVPMFLVMLRHFRSRV